MSNSPVALGAKIETIDLGRSRRGFVTFFEAPEQLAGQHNLTEKLKNAAENEGLEFVRVWDSFALSVVVVTPLLGSLVFVAIWVGVFVRRGHDLQLTMQTAFSVASFMVTASTPI